MTCDPESARQKTVLLLMYVQIFNFGPTLPIVCTDDVSSVVGGLEDGADLSLVCCTSRTPTRFLPVPDDASLRT